MGHDKKQFAVIGYRPRWYVLVSGVTEARH